ncbi:MAG TPA: branched-chain amino acid ABC transporter permease [Gammaproteobacteria bacterium]|nr:branched-chain amino acid ABC transporter permease [Gammaproteobacteria bacterium]
MMRAGDALRRWGVPVTLATALAVFAVFGVYLSPRWLFFLQTVFVLGLFAVATNLLVGYGGLVSFGQASFYGLGAYVLALGWLHYKAPFVLLFVLAPVFGAVAALVVGALALRARHLYFALLTLAFSQLFFTIANQWYGFTSGANGVFGAMVPRVLAAPRVGYWFILAVSFVSIFLLWLVKISPFGLTLQAIRENRKRAEAIGVDVYRHQLYAFVIAGAFAALAGALFVVHDQSAYPGLLDWTKSGEPILMAMIGGLDHFLGPLVGAAVFQFAHDYLLKHTHAWELVLGLVLLAIVLFAPDGLLGVLSWRNRASSGSVRVRLARILGAAAEEDGRDHK